MIDIIIIRAYIDAFNLKKDRILCKNELSLMKILLIRLIVNRTSTFEKLNETIVNGTQV